MAKSLFEEAMESTRDWAANRISEAVTGFDYEIDAGTVYRTIFGTNPDERIARMQKRIYGTALERGTQEPWKKGDIERGKPIPIRIKERIDMMNIAAELDQEYNTMVESEYEPTYQSEEREGEKFYTFRDRNQITDAYEALKQHIPEMEREAAERKASNKPPKTYSVGYRKEVKAGKKDFAYSDQHVGMERFNVGVGEDERGKYFSVYDPWNIDKYEELGSQVIYPGFEIYDRHYYKTPEQEIRKADKDKKKFSLRSVATGVLDKTEVDDRIFEFLKKAGQKARGIFE